MRNNVLLYWKIVLWGNNSSGFYGRKLRFTTQLMRRRKTKFPTKITIDLPPQKTILKTVIPLFYDNRRDVHVKIVAYQLVIEHVTMKQHIILE